ncbi:hypothetical protein GUJ93_ZPchr0002g23469 [Zizania palustris]|uniref:Uncharacterized protein n=1 Tax=Zizania palustris TaxID=103762 RepID=A0A8J5S0E0_ZIZPA|nr:hypothetical protein GUJ93_ZPchr0002g23469 [Zizania palustris]
MSHLPLAAAMMPPAKTLFLLTPFQPPALLASAPFQPPAPPRLHRLTATTAAVSGTTARERRLAKIREERRRRRRQHEHDHSYPGWARVLENACRDDDELRAILGDSIGNPELMKQRIQERVRKKGRAQFNKSKTGSIVAFKVSFQE